MYAINEAGWLLNADHCPSPNFNARPNSRDISLLVIHNISLPAGKFGLPYIRQLFCNTLDCECDPSFADLKGLEVSAHLLIARDGSITQFVPFTERAWHAGVSQFCGRENCNDFSIGVELEGDDTTPYTEQQYRELQLVTQTLQCYYPGITKERIVGHCDIAPGRKTDPGPVFDWEYYKKALD
ncbi:1,6-anhydro-N-acetylmuramyl-L-alanine amidase AmpD [Spongiibacter sp. KMU-158]|uniref:1,6-anhydro-N-acetylmuramyl-L-alanine amidase AmpD n=1 Tax=Spongiibacter pelagi TaxID=2760804 RepID=A0A927GWS1_9GAMM|nr:1,6-anhydro-N-acetylmuramyl-L-alanine amidase AmpD [Spongiibacter pelagi]MBD2859760.1 1,6-anhydro-N-acetylmuramyl-L-alanine amidase AmpD [Spongiibacter pelagi]